MTILICIPCLLTGGTEVQTLSMVRALVMGGHDVTVACYFEHSSDMRRRYEQAGAHVILLSPGGTRPVGVWRTVRFLWSGLRHIVRSLHPDVAHIQYMAPGALPIIILKLLGVRCIVATAHTAADIYSRRTLQLLCWLTSHILSGFQCITQRAERSFFGSVGQIGDSHFTIHNCLPQNAAIADGIANRAVVPHPLTIGVVSRLERIKGMDLVVPAFKCLRGNLRLLIVGDGSLRHDMEQQADGAPNIEFLGRQSQEALAAFYDRIDILLMPSRSEGFGLTAIEGMARGCVPVVANIGGLPEVVEDGRNGLLHNPADTADMAAKIQSLINNPDALWHLRQQALRRAWDFTFERYAEQMCRWYENLKSKI